MVLSYYISRSQFKRWF